MKAVRELSKEIGVTKQSINYYIRQNKNKFDKHIKKVGQANKLDEKAQNIIEKHFKQSDKVNRNKQGNSEKTNEKQPEIAGKTELERSQEKTIKILREELASRREELKMAQNLIDQQQKLTLQTNNIFEHLREENKQLKLTAENNRNKSENKPENSENSQQKNKKGWKFWK